MTFSEAGRQVVGTVMSQSIIGTSQASTLLADGAVLTGELCQTCWDCEGVCGTSVRSVSAQVDKPGRMTGTFEMSRKGGPAASTSARSCGSR